MKNDKIGEINSIIGGDESKSTFIRYKSVVAELMKISYRTEHDCVLTEKLRKYAFALSNKLMKGEGEFGDTQYCVLAKITKNGYEYLNPEPASQGFSVIAIDDEYGAVADELLSFIKNEAVSRRIDIICCYNPFLQYSLERIILPHKKAAVCRSSSLCRVENVSRRIHADRFCDKDELMRHKQLLSYNKKIIKELLPDCHRFEQ